MQGVTIFLSHAQSDYQSHDKRAVLIAYFSHALVPTSALPQRKWKDYVEQNDPENIFNQVR